MGEVSRRYRCRQRLGVCEGQKTQHDLCGGWGQLPPGPASYKLFDITLLAFLDFLRLQLAPLVSRHDLVCLARNALHRLSDFVFLLDVASTFPDRSQPLCRVLGVELLDIHDQVNCRVVEATGKAVHLVPANVNADTRSPVTVLVLPRVPAVDIFATPAQAEKFDEVEDWHLLPQPLHRGQPGAVLVFIPSEDFSAVSVSFPCSHFLSLVFQETATSVTASRFVSPSGEGATNPDYIPLRTSQS